MMFKLRRILAFVLMMLAIAVLVYGTFIEIDRYVVVRDTYLFADGVIGLAALVISGALALPSYLLWRWSN